MKWTSTLVTAHAILLVLTGAALVFVPEEIGRSAWPKSATEAFAQLLGAAMLGFGAANWVARQALLGSIYGRAVVVGNQVFSLVGALALLDTVWAEWDLDVWALFAILVYGAVLHSVLLFRGPQGGG